MKKLVRTIRDNPLLLAILVAGLKAFRALGLLRGERYFRHVPYRGLIWVDCENDRKFAILGHGGEIENGLYWEGLYSREPASMREWIRLAAGARTVLDIGANCGIFTLAAAAAGADRIHAFEPIPRIHRILTTNVQLNRMNNVICSPTAIGEQVGEAEIYDPGSDAPTSASISAEFARSRFGSRIASHLVPITSVDRYCLENALSDVDLVKIDVEGYEEFALKGMRETVKRSRPTILMEVLDGYESVLRPLTALLFDDSYEWLRINEGFGTPGLNVLLLPKRKA